MTARQQVHEIVQPSGTAVRPAEDQLRLELRVRGSRPHAATHVGSRPCPTTPTGPGGVDDDATAPGGALVWDEENRLAAWSTTGHEISSCTTTGASA